MRRRRTALLTLFLLILVLLVGLAAVPVALTWREVQQDRQQEKLNRALIAAVNRNDAAAVRRLLRQGVDPNARVLPEDKRLFWTRCWDRLRQVSPESRVHESALMRAASWLPSKGDPVDNVEVVKALVDAGAQVNFVGDDIDAPTLRSTPLIEAAFWGKPKVVALLLSYQAPVNEVDQEGDTALICASLSAEAEIVDLLLKRGANVNVRDCRSRSALLAACKGYERNNAARVRKIVASLLKHDAVVQGQDEDRETALSLARHCNDQSLILMLTQYGAKE